MEQWFDTKRENYTGKKKQLKRRGNFEDKKRVAIFATLLPLRSLVAIDHEIKKPVRIPFVSGQLSYPFLTQEIQTSKNHSTFTSRCDFNEEEFLCQWKK